MNFSNSDISSIFDFSMIKNAPDFSNLEKIHENLNNGELEYNPFSFHSLHSFNPVHYYYYYHSNNNSFSKEKFEENIDSICFNNNCQFIDLEKVYNNNSKNIENKDSYIKHSPLLDPVRFMIGKYDNNYEKYSLEKFKSKSKNELNELINNASYVDSFFCYLSSQLLHKYGFFHGIGFYGSFNGIQSSFKYNISDDYDYLHESTFFNTNKTKMFKLHPYDYKTKLTIQRETNDESEIDIDIETIDDMEEITKKPIFRNEILENERITDEPIFRNEIHENENTLSAKLNGGEGEEDKKIDIEVDDECNLDFVKPDFLINDDSYKDDEGNDSEEVEDDEDDEDDEDNNVNAEEDEKDEEEDEDEEEENEDDDDTVEDEDEEEEGKEADDSVSEYESESDSEDRNEVFAYIKDFPVQLICLEKCDGTLDSLFEDGKINEENGKSVLFQIAMTLLVYQKLFNLTHNDLHTNNIMYVNTDIEYLYYKYKNVNYRVPTFGKIFKIIDFGRAIYTFQNNVHCSDSFAFEGDANTQYNFPPYYNDKKPRIEPNYAFDLCRLGCSIYDFIIDSDSVSSKKKFDNFQKYIYHLCSDDKGKNILYKKDGDDRYPNFKLYKMIARTVHHCTPEKEISHKFFKEYIQKETNQTSNWSFPPLCPSEIPTFSM